MDFYVLLASLGVLVGEFYGSFVGGGSIITQFFLQTIIGMDIKNAIALDNTAALAGEIMLVVTLMKRNKFEWWFLPLIIFGLIGSYLGVQLLLFIPEFYLKIVFLLALAGVLLKMFLGDPRKKAGILSVVTDTWSIVGLSLAGLVIGLYNSFLSIGDFVVGLLILIAFFNVKYQRAIFVLSLMLVFSRSFAATNYFAYDLIDLKFAIPMFLAAGIAGTAAGTLMNKFDMDWIEGVLKYLGIGIAALIAVSFFT